MHFIIQSTKSTNMYFKIYDKKIVLIIHMTFMIKLGPRRVAIEALPCFEMPRHKGHKD